MLSSNKRGCSTLLSNVKLKTNSLKKVVACDFRCKLSFSSLKLLCAGCARYSNFLQQLTVEHYVGVAVAVTVAVQYKIILKGLGHAILGNFSIDQMVIELNNGSKT